MSRRTVRGGVPAKHRPAAELGRRRGVRRGDARRAGAQAAARLIARRHALGARTHAGSTTARAAPASIDVDGEVLRAPTILEV